MTRFKFICLCLAFTAATNAATYTALTLDGRKAAIGHQCGQYNAATGAFEYKDAAPDLTVAMPVPPRKPSGCYQGAKLLHKGFCTDKD